MSRVGFDERAVTIDGRRTLILSGAIHYPRSTPEMWPELIDRSRQAGLNTIETYVFWNLHERRRGVLDFSGRLNLLEYLRLIQQAGMHAILRIGPYICAETNYGGLPPWLREVDGVQMRTWNQPFMREMERWTRMLCQMLQPMFAPAGGPIILAQIENEYANVAAHYGPAGEKYLAWCVELTQSLNLGVPTVMCSGGAPGALETINSFAAHRELDAHWSRHPEQPALWTEHWTGWYDTWGSVHHTRPAEQVAYATARFFAAGGSGVNHYMWHGGTNFGRESMYLQTTSYDFDAPLDEFGLETTKSRHLGRLHRILADYAEVLLGSPRPVPQAVGPKQAIYGYERDGRWVDFLCNDDSTPAEAPHRNAIVFLPAKSVVIVGPRGVLMNTARVESGDAVLRKMVPAGRCIQAVRCWRDAGLGDVGPDACKQALPAEQLAITHDESDYCWYRTRLKVSASRAGRGVLEFEGAADLLYVYVDGKLKASTASPLKEDRKQASDWTQRFDLNLSEGTHELAVLCCSLGMIKGDWMLGMRNMAQERKGLWGQVRWGGRVVGGPWTMQAGLMGERCGVFGPAGDLVDWKPPGVGVQKPLVWWRVEFSRPSSPAPLVADLLSMRKGLLWLNGCCAGRYWLAEAHETAPDPAGQGVGHKGLGVPTQRYYHLPASWLVEGVNVLTLLEEQGGEGEKIRICQCK